MSETKALAIRQLTPAIWELIQAVAPAMHQSRLFGVKSTDQAMAIMLKGYELGLGLAASFEFIQVIQDKPTLSPRGALALIHQSGELTHITISDKPDECFVAMERRSGFRYQLLWTMDDARKAGLIKPNSAWETYGPNMLRWRCIGFVADVVFPDILGGLKRADEFGAVINTQGDVIDVAPSPPPQPEHAFIPQQAWSLEQLVDRHGAEAVMSAAGGIIPATEEELAEVAEKLEAQNG